MDQGMSAFQAQMALEENPEQFMPQILERIGGMGGSTDAKAMALKKFMPNLSMRQAFEMAQGAEQGDLGTKNGGGEALGDVQRWAKEQGFSFEGDKAAQGAAYVAQQEQATQGAFGLAGASAGLQNKQIAGGEKAAGGIMRMRGREIGMATQGAEIGTQVADFTSGIIAKYGDALASKDPIGAIFSQLGEDASALFGTLASKVSEAVDQLAEKLTGSKTTDAVKELSAASPDELANAFKLAIQDLITFLRQQFERIPGAAGLFGGGGGGGAAPALRPGT